MKFKVFLVFLLTLVLILPTSLPIKAAKVKQPIDRGVFIDYAKGKGNGHKPPSGGIPTDQSTTYKYNGVHWETPNVTYRVDQASSGLDPASALAAVQAGFDAWENELNPFGLPDASIIDYTYDLSPVTTSGEPKLDGENSVSWGTTPSNAIAVTYYWYTRRGKKLVEFDMVLSKALPWSAAGAANTYDVQNITTHEAGHTLVLLDLYNYADSKLTMYGYGALGETNKRDLGLGDMLGVEKIYPAP